MLATLSEQSFESVLCCCLVAGKGNVCHLQRGTSQECVDVAAVADVAAAVVVSIINWEQ